MIHAFALQALAAAKRLPLAVWLMLALMVALPVNGCVQHARGYDKGRETVLAKLRAAEAAADYRALEAIKEAEGHETAEVQRFEAEQDALRGAIEAAEGDGGNALDAYFR